MVKSELIEAVYPLDKTADDLLNYTFSQFIKKNLSYFNFLLQK
jgi:hypothetical protein